MDLKNDQELMNTQRKLRNLEALYEEDAKETGGDVELREAEMESLKRQIDRLREEIARYQARHPVAK